MHVYATGIFIVEKMMQDSIRHLLFSAAALAALAAVVAASQIR